MASKKIGRTKKSVVKKPASRKTVVKKSVRTKTSLTKSVSPKKTVKKSVGTKSKAKQSVSTMKKSVSPKKTVKNSASPTKSSSLKKATGKKVTSANIASPLTRKKVARANKTQSTKSVAKSKVATKTKALRIQKKATALKTASKSKTAQSSRVSPVAKTKKAKKTTVVNKQNKVAKKAGTENKRISRPSSNKKKNIPNKDGSKLVKGSRKKVTTKKITSKTEDSDALTSPSHSDLGGYSILDYVVYPSHGVGKITGIEEHEVGDQVLTVFVIEFDKEKMTLRVPLGKVKSSGMRQLSSQQTMERAITTLKGRARTRRVMWSRRAQEYDAKLNSGDPISIAEVVRDLHRNETQPDQSYSERQMYEAALERLAREYAAMENTNTEQATEELEKVLRVA